MEKRTDERMPVIKKYIKSEIEEIQKIRNKVIEKFKSISDKIIGFESSSPTSELLDNIKEIQFLLEKMKDSRVKSHFEAVLDKEFKLNQIILMLDLKIQNPYFYRIFSNFFNYFISNLLNFFDFALYIFLLLHSFISTFPFLLIQIKMIYNQNLLLPYARH